MRRVGYAYGGGFEQLEMTSSEVPTPGQGQLLVRVDAIGVTRAAVFGTLTADIAGEVVAVGECLDDWMPGYRVVGRSAEPGYAEYALLDADSASTIPDGASAVDAVALVRSGIVALGAIDAARPRSGESALITAAAGGVGHLAVQAARVRGVKRVVAAVSDRSKTAFLDGFGVDEVRTYDELSTVEPVDIVLDALGGDLLAPLLTTLAPGGRLVAYGSDTGAIALADLLDGPRAVLGFDAAHLARDTPDVHEHLRQELWQYFASGQVVPTVHAEYPLADAARAHEVLAARANLGKIVLIP
ncbi:quinone oxidoreductase family protein [Nocardia takedensis]